MRNDNHLLVLVGPTRGRRINDGLAHSFSLSAGDAHSETTFGQDLPFLTASANDLGRPLSGRSIIVLERGFRFIDSGVLSVDARNLHQSKVSPGVVMCRTQRMRCPACPGTSGREHLPDEGARARRRDTAPQHRVQTPE